MLVFSGLTVTGRGDARAATPVEAFAEVTKAINCATVVITPKLGLTFGADHATAIPADHIGYTATVSNTGSIFGMGGFITVEGSRNGQTANVVGYWDSLEYRSPTKGWVSFAVATAVAPGYTMVDPAPSGVSLGLRLQAGQAAVGVTYPASGDPIVGTVVANEATASWAYTTAQSLNPAQIALLSDPRQVIETRNVVHVEIGPRPATASQPFFDYVTFPNPLQATATSRHQNLSCPGLADRDGGPTMPPSALPSPQSPNATGVMVTITPPSGAATTFTAPAVAGLATLAPGASTPVTLSYAVPVPAARGQAEASPDYLQRLQQLNNLILHARATATASTRAGPVSAGPVVAATTEQLPVVGIAKSGPASAQPGTTAQYSLALANTGAAPASQLAVTDTVGSAMGIVTGTPTALAPGATASAVASYAIPLTQPSGPLADTGAATWTDANHDRYGPSSSEFTTQVIPLFLGATLTLAPPVSGPDITGTSQALSATFADRAGNPLPNETVTFTITGANPATTAGTTNASGVATLTYSGTNDGTDTVVAGFRGGGTTVTSNTATVGWVTPIEQVSTTKVTGRFYSGGCGSFCADVSKPPLWTQDFSTIDFNPPAGTVPDNISGVGVDTRPFTDITTNAVGDFTGSAVAQGNGYQAGVGPLNGFDAVFTGDYLVASPGDVTFNFYSDDGFIFGVSGGATRVGGSLSNPPPATELEGYPIMGSYNQPTSPSANQITVHFPAAGSYPYEVDYSECCGGQLALTMATSATGHGVAPAGNLSVTPVNVPVQTIGQPVKLTVAAMDAGGKAVSGLPLTMAVSGPNEQTVTGTTDASGLAVLSYVGHTSGSDLVVVGANVSGVPAVSNSVNVTWAFGSGGTTTTPPPVITGASPPDGSVVTKPVPVNATFSPPSGQSITAWSVTYQAASASTATALASGIGTPPSPLATFDPTQLLNDTYTITVSATASGGGTQTGSTTVAVFGNLKLGSYVTTYQDLSVPVNGFQMKVDRTYDSIDKRTGDFGVGWHISVSTFTVSANRVLGAGGWTEYPTSCIFGLCNWAFKDSSKHFVTVTYPDGHQVVFDFTPSGGQAVFYFQGSSLFTARPGTNTTSTLQVAGDTSVNYGFDGNVYDGGNNLFNPTRFTLTEHDGTVLVLDTHSGLVSETDRAGNSLTVDANGVHASNGESVTYHRDGQGRITEIDGPASVVLKYGYTGADLTSFTDGANNTTTYSYQPADELDTTKGAGGMPLQTIQFDANGRIQSVTDANGNKTLVHNDVAGQQQTISDPNTNLVTINTFDDIGDVVSTDQVFSGHDHVTAFKYDADGRVTQRTDPLNNTYETGYDALGDITSFTDAKHNQTTYGYNSFGQLLSITPPGAARPQVTMVYDATTGNLMSEQYDGLAATTYTYYPTGATRTITDPLNHVVTYTYDANGHAQSITDANQHTTQFVVDGAGLTRSQTDATGATITFGYDGDGRLTSVTDAANHIRTYHFNVDGQVDKATDADGNFSTFGYYPGGRLKQVTDRDGQVTAYRYDADGHLAQQTMPGGDVTTFQYDPLGEVTSGTNAAATDTLGYDAGGQTVSESVTPVNGSPQPPASFAYTYDPNGNRLTMTSQARASAPSQLTGYSYDGLDRLATVTDPARGRFTFGYNSLSQLTSLTRPNGVNDTLAPDGAGNLASVASAMGATTVASAAYTYTPNNSRQTLTDLSGASNYGYDPANQLNGATHPTSGPAGETYTYDLAGNRASSATAPVGSFSYDNADRLLADAAFTYTYDNEGDQRTMKAKANGATTTYDWNAAHQLLAVHLPDGTVTSYRYDPFGRRIEIDANGQVTRFSYDGNNVAYTYDGSGSVVAAYTNGLGEGAPLELTTGGASYYYLRDGMGSTTALTDATGVAVDRYRYDSFGNQTATGSVANADTFTGAPFDRGTGLYYLRARYYDPVTGRFLSEDPLLAANPYVYAANNPTNFVDPSGKDAVEYAALFVGPRLSFAVRLQKFTACVAGQLLKIAAIMQNPTVELDTSNEGFLVAHSLVQNLAIDPVKDAAIGQLDPFDQAIVNLQQSLSAGGPSSPAATASTAAKVTGNVGEAIGAPESITSSLDVFSSLADSAETVQKLNEAVAAVCNGDPRAGETIDALCG